MTSGTSKKTDPDRHGGYYAKNRVHLYPCQVEGCKGNIEPRCGSTNNIGDCTNEFCDQEYYFDEQADQYLMLDYAKEKPWIERRKQKRTDPKSWLNVRCGAVK